MSPKISKIIDFKCYQFSKALGLTLELQEYGKIHAVRGPDYKWVFKGRKAYAASDRKKIDEVFDSALQEIYNLLEYLPRCETCRAYLHDDVCLACDVEEAL